MSLINFTELQKRKKAYAGANGSKISVIYEGEQYMLKFPPVPGRNKNMSYSNSCYSEYLGCQIFESIGIPVQKTLLGVYTVKGKQKNHREYALCQRAAKVVLYDNAEGAKSQDIGLFP